VVSTSIADVVADLSDVVAIADDAAGFAGACRAATGPVPPSRRRRIRQLLADREWDVIAERMQDLLEAVGADAVADGRAGQGATA
jgi:hypothetical protein